MKSFCLIKIDAPDWGFEMTNAYKTLWKFKKLDWFFAFALTR